MPSPPHPPPLQHTYTHTQKHSVSHSFSLFYCLSLTLSAITKKRARGAEVWPNQPRNLTPALSPTVTNMAFNILLLSINCILPKFGAASRRAPTEEAAPATITSRTGCWEHGCPRSTARPETEDPLIPDQMLHIGGLGVGDARWVGAHHNPGLIKANVIFHSISAHNPLFELATGCWLEEQENLQLKRLLCKNFSHQQTQKLIILQQGSII